MPTVDPAGNAAPVGGFKDLGWYSGYQFHGGTFAPVAGMIHPGSPQAGAGQMVSSAVNAQSDAAQGLKPGTIDSYVAQQNNNPANQAVPGGGSGGGVGGTGQPTGSSGGGVGITPPAAIDLPGMYQSLSDKAGISDLESQLTAKQQAFNDAQSKINDNPFLSEATRVGRIQKLTTDYNNDIANVQNTLAMKKADIQTQIDLQTKQFDINSQAAQQGLQQFQTLLDSGALAGASGQDIANITRATGMSSSMIQSAINANTQKNVQTSVVQFDDGTNQGYAVINTKTGAVINKQIIGPSKPTGGGSPLTALDYQLKTDQISKEQAPQVLLAGAKQGKTLGDMMSYGAANGVSKQQVYDIYAGINYYHATAAQVKADKKAYGIK